MQTHKSIFNEMKFQNKKCENFLDVSNIDQIKEKMDCLKFLSTPYAFDALFIKDQDFYHKNKEETYEKVFNLCVTNKVPLINSSKKVTGQESNSKKIFKHSTKKKIDMDSSSIIKFFNENNLKEYFRKIEKNEKRLESKNLEYSQKTNFDMLNYFKNLSEKGINIEDLKNGIKNFTKGNSKDNQNEANKKREMNIQTKNNSVKFYRTFENSKIHKLNLKKLNYHKELNSNLQEESHINFKEDKVTLNPIRGSSSDNRISNFFFTNPDLMTLNRKISIKTMKSNNNRKNIKQKNYSVIYPVEKFLKSNSKEYLNEIFANTQAKGKFLLNDSDIEDFCKTGIQTDKFEEKDFEKFLKLKKLEIETNKVTAPNIEKINENMKNIDKFIKTRYYKKSKFKIGQSYSKENISYTINYKKNKHKLKSQEKCSEKLKKFNEKNSSELDKKDLYDIIDNCHLKSQINRNVMFQTLKEYYKKNEKVEGVMTKLKGYYNTSADEYIKDITLQDYKNKGLFLYGEKQGYYNKHYMKIYGIEKDLMRFLN